MGNIVKIEKMIHNGYGIARSDNKIIFVSNVLPGETVNIKIIDQKKNYDFAIPVDIIESSSKRINPECIYYPQCGGCHLLHTDYDNQINIKNRILNSFLEKNVPEVVTDFVLPEKNRNHKMAASFIVKDSKTGFYKRHTNDFVEIDYCIQLDDMINKFIKESEIPGSIKKVNIKTDNQNNISSNINKMKGKNRKLNYQLEDITLKYDYKSFFQSNKYMIEKWLEIIRTEAEQFSLKRVLDLYSGVGIISLYLSKKLKIKKISGIESDNQAVNYAKINRIENKCFNTNFISGKAEKVLNNYNNVTLIILNPPRRGANKNIIQKITRLNPEGIIYSSCEISNLIRDMQILSGFGYKCKKIIPLDMFPNTYHFEVIGVFKK